MCSGSCTAKKMQGIKGSLEVKKDSEDIRDRTAGLPRGILPGPLSQQRDVLLWAGFLQVYTQEPFLHRSFQRLTQTYSKGSHNLQLEHGKSLNKGSARKHCNQVTVGLKLNVNYQHGYTYTC